MIAECTETIGREVAGLKAMVDEFSRFARLPATRLELASLNEVVNQAVGLYEERLDGAHIALQLDPDLPATMLDVEQIKRVFVNLIDNALEALVSVSDERLITITTSRDVETGVVRVEVADTGQGSRPLIFVACSSHTFHDATAAQVWGSRSFNESSSSIVERFVLRRTIRMEQGL